MYLSFPPKVSRSQWRACFASLLFDVINRVDKWTRTPHFFVLSQCEGNIFVCERVPFHQCLSSTVASLNRFYYFSLPLFLSVRDRRGAEKPLSLLFWQYLTTAVCARGGACVMAGGWSIFKGAQVPPLQLDRTLVRRTLPNPVVFSCSSPCCLRVPNS